MSNMKYLLYLFISTLLLGCCDQNPDIWKVPQETQKCIITKHYEPLTLDNGEVICGALSELDLAYGFSNEVEHGIPGAYSDTVYYDKFGNTLLIKDIQGYRKRVYYVKPEDKMPSKQIIQYGEGRAVLEITRNSNHDIIKVKNTVKGYLPTGDKIFHEEKQTRDKQGRLVKIVRDNSIIINVEYPPSPSDKNIEFYTTTRDGEKTEESTWVYDAESEKLLYNETTQYEDYPATVTKHKYSYDEKWNCIYQDIVTTKNTEIQRWNRYGWEYNQNNDVISVHCAFYMNGKTQTITIEGETMQEIAHSELVDAFEKDKLWDAGAYLYEYKYNSRGEWIYRVAYRQDPEDVIMLRKQMGEPLENLRPQPTAITVRDIQYYD